MTDSQIAALAAVVRTRHALEEATAEHDKAIRTALHQGLSTRRVADSAAASYRQLRQTVATRQERHA